MCMAQGPITATITLGGQGQGEGKGASCPAGEGGGAPQPVPRDAGSRPAAPIGPVSVRGQTPGPAPKGGTVQSGVAAPAPPATGARPQADPRVSSLMGGGTSLMGGG